MTSYVAPEFVHWLASQYIAGHHLLCFVLCQISPWYHHGSHDTWRNIFTERLVPIASPQYAIIHRRDNNNTRTNLYIFILYIYIYIISIYLSIYIYIVYISYHMHMKSLCHLYFFSQIPRSYSISTWFPSSYQTSGSQPFGYGSNMARQWMRFDVFHVSCLSVWNHPF